MLGAVTEQDGFGSWHCTSSTWHTCIHRDSRVQRLTNKCQLAEQLSGWSHTAASLGALGEHEPCIDQDVAVAHADEHAVHADLAQPSHRQDAQRRPLPCAPCLVRGTA